MSALYDRSLTFPGREGEIRAARRAASLARHAAAVAEGVLPPYVTIYDLQGDDTTVRLRLVLDRTRRDVERVYGLRPELARDPAGADTEGGAQ